MEMRVEVNFFRQLSIVFFILSALSLSRSETIRRVVTAGDNVTLHCDTSRSSTGRAAWYNETNVIYYVALDSYAVRLGGVPEYKYSVEFLNDWNNWKSSFTLTIMHSSEEDSGSYRCYHQYYDTVYGHHNSLLSDYYIDVIQCTCNLINSIQDGIQEQNVSCDVNGYSESESRLSLKINITTIGGMAVKDGILEMGNLNFTISTNELQNLKRIIFNPFPDYQSHVSCNLPDRLPTTSRTTPITTKRGDRTQASTPFSTTSMLVTSNPESDDQETTPTAQSNNNMIIIIAAVIGLMIFILTSIVIFFFIRHLKGRRTSNDRTERREDEQKDAVKDEGVYYASVKDSIDSSGHVYATSIGKTKTHSQESISHHENDISDGRMVDNTLYVSSDFPLKDEGDHGVEEPDNMPLYAMPDKAGVRSGRYSTDHPGGEHSMGDGRNHDPQTHCGGGQGGHDITDKHFDPTGLYATPDKGPGKSQGLLKTHETNDDRASSHDVSSLYAQVDKGGHSE